MTRKDAPASSAHDLPCSFSLPRCDAHTGWCVNAFCPNKHAKCICHKCVKLFPPMGRGAFFYSARRIKMACNIAVDTVGEPPNGYTVLRVECHPARSYQEVTCLFGQYWIMLSTQSRGHSCMRPTCIDLYAQVTLIAGVRNIYPRWIRHASSTEWIYVWSNQPLIRKTVEWSKRPQGCAFIKFFMSSFIKLIGQLHLGHALTV